MSLRDLLGRAVLLTPPPPPPAARPVHYVCPSCDVAGYGAVCWCCGADVTPAGGLVRVPATAGTRELTA